MSRVSKSAASAGVDETNVAATARTSEIERNSMMERDGGYGAVVRTRYAIYICCDTASRLRGLSMPQDVPCYPSNILGTKRGTLVRPYYVFSKRSSSHSHRSSNPADIGAPRRSRTNINMEIVEAGIIGIHFYVGQSANADGRGKCMFDTLTINKGTTIIKALQLSMKHPMGHNRDVARLNLWPNVAGVCSTIVAGI